jgi:hypothetical protein
VPLVVKVYPSHSDWSDHLTVPVLDSYSVMMFPLDVLGPFASDLNYCHSRDIRIVFPPGTAKMSGAGGQSGYTKTLSQQVPFGIGPLPEQPLVVQVAVLVGLHELKLARCQHVRCLLCLRT